MIVWLVGLVAVGVYLLGPLYFLLVMIVALLLLRPGSSRG